MSKLFKQIKEASDGLTFLPDSNKVEGTIGITCVDQARYSHFTACVARIMQRCPNIKLHMRIGNQLTAARNQIIEAAEGNWLWWMDDDHVFDVNLLPYLLSLKKDMVAPLYIMRQMPPMPTMRITHIDENGKERHAVPNIWINPPGLYEVDSTGMAGLLVKRKVWEKMSKPYFITGHIHPDENAEDIYFCNRAKELGFKLYVDTRVVIGHIAPTIMIPEFKNNQWTTKLQFPNGDATIVCGPKLDEKSNK